MVVVPCIGVIGLGSMGTRRLLQSLILAQGSTFIVSDMDRVRVKAAEARQGNILGIWRDEEGVDDRLMRADAIFLCVPPDKHEAILGSLEQHAIRMQRGRPLYVFVEAGIEPSRDYEKLEIWRSTTIRHHPLVRELQTKFAKDPPLMFTHHCGHYLPQWHPSEPYYNVYFSRKRSGACREMLVFELQWLTMLFGKVDSIRGMGRRTQSLIGNADDHFAVVVQFESGVIGTITIDALSHYIRDLKVTLDAGRTVTWQGLEGDAWMRHKDDVSFYAGKMYSNEWSMENVYTSETLDFLKYASGDVGRVFSVAEYNELARLLERFEEDARL